MKMKLRNRIAGLLLSGAIASGAFVGATIALSGPALAQEGGGEGGSEEPRRRSQTLDPAVAKVLNEVFELLNLQPPQYQTALTKLNDLIAAKPNMKAYDKATTYQMRASVRVNLEDYQGALRDFQTALDSNGFELTQNNQLRYYIAQIQFQLGNYQAAIQGLNAWISAARAAGLPVDCNAQYLLAAAYTQITPPNWRGAVGPAEQTIACRAEPKKNDYDLLNLIYSELGDNTKRGPLLEKMINNWPNERSYWVQLSGFYSNTGKDQDAFAVLEVAYRAGLLSKESELITLVNYYSFFDNPYRGARMMEREMDAGRIARNTKNLTLLAQLWSQAREHKRAIPVLRAAAQSAGTGELYYRLGQVLLADEQYAESEKALTSAINKGGMQAEKIGDAWLLLGTARFSRAGPDDCDQRNRARQAFVSASRYPKSSRQASDWVRYIDAINKTQKDQAALEAAQGEDERQATIARLKTAVQVCRLQGGANCAQLEAQLKAIIDAGPVKPKSVCTAVGSTDAGTGQGSPDAAPPETPPAPAETEGGAQ
jgi:tetratricopeptide (TPR) repeat protein